MICFAQILTIIKHDAKSMHNISAWLDYYAQFNRYFVQSMNYMHNQCTHILTYAQKTDSSVQNYSVCN